VVASDDPDPDGPQRNETTTERADRNWNELLQELRVTQTGLQILTGFLLTLPFQQRFSELTTWLRVVLLVAVALAVTSTVLVVAPVAWHRVLFRRNAKPELVSAAHRLTKAGLTSLALTIVAVVVLVFGFVAGAVAAAVAGAVAALLFVLQWVVLPRRIGARLPPPRR
jgi:O-antigen/teichoic acid export membrane protein